MSGDEPVKAPARAERRDAFCAESTEEVAALEAQTAAWGLRVGAWVYVEQDDAFLAGPRCRALLGAHSGGEELVEAQAWWGCFLGETRQRARMALQTVVSGLAAEVQVEGKVMGRDGSMRWIRMRAQRRHEAGGRAEIRGTVEDVTAQRAEVERLREAEARYRALVDGCPDGIAVIREGRIVYANPRMLELLGARDGAAIAGALLLEFVDPDAIPRVIAALRALSEGAAHAPVEATFMRLDRKRVRLELSGLVAPFEGSRAVIVFARDVSRRHELQAQLAHTDRMATLGTLAAGVAHEINNPLTYVSVNLQDLLEELPEVQQAARALERDPHAEGATAVLRRFVAGLGERIEEAFEGAARVQAIVSELKHFAREDDGAPRAPVHVLDAVRAATRMARHELRYRARLVEELDDEVPAVWGHDGRLRQVFLNVLLNAAQAIEPGDVDNNEVRVRVRAAKGHVRVEISDTGCGIPPEHLDRIFDPFFTTKPAGVGSGLGLAICRHLVEEMGGDICVESTQGKGTTVTIQLAAAFESTQSVTGRTDAIAGDDRAAGERGAAEAEHMVLLVDDEQAILRALARQLGRSFPVATASSVDEAVRWVEENGAPGIVLCDLMMPGKTGMDFYAWMNAHEPEAVERIVFLTGGAMSEATASFLAEVDNIVLDKPVDPGQLKRLVATLLRTVPTPQRQRPERRRAPRMPGDELAAFLAAGNHVERAVVLDWSEVGLRVRPASRRVDDWALAVGEDVSVMLRRKGRPGMVQADARIVRCVGDENLGELCLEITSMDATSRHIYQSWIDEVFNALRHPTPAALPA